MPSASTSGAGATNTPPAGTQPVASGVMGAPPQRSDGSVQPAQSSPAMPAGQAAAGAGDAPAMGVAATGAGGANAAEPAASGTGMPHYEALEDLPNVRQEHSVVALDGKIFLIGGFLEPPQRPTDTVVAYDVEAKAWQMKGKLPMPIQHVNAGVVNGKIYVAGFFTGTGRSPEGGVFEYDPAADQWSTGRMPLPSPRAASCVTGFEGKLYVFGGGTAAGYTSVAVASAYDVAADSWQDIKPLPGAREHCSAGVIGSKIYVVGGRANSVATGVPATYAYDPTTDEYQELAPIPVARGGLAGAVMGGRYFTFGGEGNPNDASGVYPNASVFDPTQGSMGTWQALPDLPRARHGYGAASIGDRVYLAGGGLRTSFTEPVAEFTSFSY